MSNHDVHRGTSDAEPVDTVTSIVPAAHGDGLVRPAASLEHIAETFLAYQQLRARLLVESDWQAISGKKFPKRSAWRKLAVAFGVSFQLVERHLERDERGRIVRAEFVVRAHAPNARFVDAWASCDVTERCCPIGCSRKGYHKHCGTEKPGVACNLDRAGHFSHAEHDVPATAHTRAINRAAADLFGMGEVSAEEVGGLGRAPEEVEPEPVEPVEPLADEQKVTIIAECERRGLDVAEVVTLGGWESLDEVPADRAGRMIEWLRRQPARVILDVHEHVAQPDDAGGCLVAAGCAGCAGPWVVVCDLGDCPEPASSLVDQTPLCSAHAANPPGEEVQPAQATLEAAGA